MGDYADDAIDMALNGNYWWPDDLLDPEDSDYVIRRKTCKHCGKKGLVWGQFNGRWRLFSGSTVHSCLTKERNAESTVP